MSPHEALWLLAGLGLVYALIEAGLWWNRRPIKLKPRRPTFQERQRARDAERHNKLDPFIPVNLRRDD